MIKTKRYKRKQSRRQTRKQTRKRTKRNTIDSIIKKHPIVLFVKPGCPYCAKAIDIMEKEGVKPKIVPLTGLSGILMQEKLLKKTQRRTVPNVFIRGKSIGGADETERLHLSGQLKDMLKIKN